MRVAIEVWVENSKSLGVFQSFHLMNHSGRHIHSLTGFHFELFDGFVARRSLNANWEPARGEKKRLGFQPMIQGAMFGAPDFQDFTASFNHTLFASRCWIRDCCCFLNWSQTIQYRRHTGARSTGENGKGCLSQLLREPCL